MNQKFRNDPVTQRRVEKSRVEKSRVYSNEVAIAVLKKTYKKYKNVYTLLATYMKKVTKGRRVPEEVIIKVCEQYLDLSKNVDDWPYFWRMLDAEYRKYNAEKNIKESQSFKKKSAVPLSELVPPNLLPKG